MVYKVKLSLPISFNFTGGNGGTEKVIRSGCKFHVGRMWTETLRAHARKMAGCSADLSTLETLPYQGPPEVGGTGRG